MDNETDSNYTVAERYRLVKENLEDLGYKQALPLESLPLIELLLVDLMQTKETLQQYQCVAKDNLRACGDLQIAIEPYKCDNVKLVQECNQLHLDLIEAKEINQKQIVESKKKIKKLENEVDDLRLSLAKNIQRIKLLETESAEKTKKILELQGKCCKPLVSNVNLATKKRACYPLRRPTLEAEALPKCVDNSSVPFGVRNVEPYIVNYVNLADQKVARLNEELIRLKDDLYLSHETAETLKSQLESQETEMSRLRHMLEGGRPCSSTNKDHLFKRGEKDCYKDELLITQQAKSNLECQLKEALSKQQETSLNALKLAERNEELERELREIELMALNVEMDCNTSPQQKKHARRKSKIQAKLDSVLSEVHSLRSEVKQSRRENNDLRRDLEACKSEKSSMQRVLETTLDEKKDMTDKLNTLTAIASQSKDSYHRKDSNEESYSCSSKKFHDNDVIIESLQNKIERLEKERDQYRHELKRSKEEYRKDSEKGYDKLWSKICDLRTQVNEKEHAITKLTKEKKEILMEKCNLENKMQNLNFHRKRSPSPCTFCPSRNSDPCGRNYDYPADKSSKIAFDRLQRERDMAMSDVDRLTEERDSLGERIKGTKGATIKGLEDQLDDLKNELRRTKQELSEQRSQYFQLRALHDQTDQALGDVQAQLARADHDLTTEIERTKATERQNMQLDNQIKELKQEINNYRCRISQLDREKDDLVLLLDEKTEKIAALENQILHKEHQTGSVSKQIHDLQHAKQVCIEQCTDLERQLRNKQLEIDNLQRQLSSAEYERDNAVHENRQLQDDLASVSHEVRSLRKDLESSKAEAKDLKYQLQTYVSEVRRAEDLLCQKENERSDLLKHFKDLSLEHSALENNNHSLETEASEAKSALHSARCHISDLERHLKEKDCLNQEYESQLLELSQNITSLEMQLRQQTDIRQSLEEDLRAANDMCSQMEKQKQYLSHNLDEETHVKTRLEAQLAIFKNEQQIFQDQINEDHIKMDQLEKMLEQTRQEVADAETNNTELHREVATLRRKVNELQEKLCDETTELRRYQAQAAEYGKQIGELRIKIVDEKFDRAKREEEILSISNENSSKTTAHTNSYSNSHSNGLGKSSLYNTNDQTNQNSDSG